MTPASTFDQSSARGWLNNTNSGTMFSNLDDSSHQDDDYTYTNPDITNINNDDAVVRLKNPVIPPADFIPLHSSSSSSSSSDHRSSISISTETSKHSHTPSFGLSSSFSQVSPLISPRTDSVVYSDDADNTTGFFNITTSPASFSITTPDVSPHPASEYNLFHSGPVAFPVNQASSQHRSITTSSSLPLTPLSLEQKSAMPPNHSPHSSFSSTTSLVSLNSHYKQEGQQIEPVTTFIPMPSHSIIQDLAIEGAIVYLLSPDGTINCVSSNAEQLLGRSHESQKNNMLSGYLYHENHNNIMYVYVGFDTILC